MSSSPLQTACNCIPSSKSVSRENNSVRGGRSTKYYPKLGLVVSALTSELMIRVNECDMSFNVALANDKELYII